MEDIEKFPVQKRQIRYEEPPELIFFDVDEDQEEAEFIRVDDLFVEELPIPEDQPGPLVFTLIPRKKGQIINSKGSRMIRRTLILTSIQMDLPIEKVRVRPNFIQWQMDPETVSEPELTVREFRADLEETLGNYLNYKENERYLADTCFVCPVSKNITDDLICQLAGNYQED